MYNICPLSAEHDRSAFDCGVAGLNDYLRRQATQDVRRDVASVYVAISSERPSAEIAGYYVLSTTGIQHVDLPSVVQKKMPRYTILPGALLGRLAVDSRHRGRGLGMVLLYDAFSKSSKSYMAWSFFVVDAKDEIVRAFYEHFGFESFANNFDHLYITRRKLQKTLDAALSATL
ncbi:MAG: GNAT family N-acetyltransferase [Synergistaceae bacterium]|nr:GNAT family N-acetyltransferase [Synergistaceae bacterium]